VASKSDLESRFLDLVREAGLPLPQLNVLVGGFLVDAYWPQPRLVIELQSWEHHGHRQAFERDNERLTRLQVAGYSVLPLTYRQLCHQPAWVIRSIAGLLAAPAAEGAAPGATL
jgi:very-short-patch-repair endonuclease